MKLDLGDYKIESDTLNFVLKERRYVEQRGEDKKPNGVLIERFVDVGYFSSIGQVLNHIPTRIALMNDDIEVINSKIVALNETIKSLEKKLK